MSPRRPLQVSFQARASTRNEVCNPGVLGESRMNVKLMIGVVLFVIGIVTAVMGIAGVGQRDAAQAAVVAEDTNAGAVTHAMGTMAIPAIAALSLAVGGLLIGVS